MGKPMSNAPVYYALAQVQFNPVAAMDKYVSEIQDGLRKKGYTHFQLENTTRLELANSPGQVATDPRVAHTALWLITKSDRTSGFLLESSSITFHTTHYESSTELIQELLTGLQIVQQVASLDHINRLGLRYLDAVFPRKEEKVDLYLSNSIHGINIDAHLNYSLTESVFQTICEPYQYNGTLIARVYRKNSRLEFPPDLLPWGLTMMSRFNISETITHAVIDTDHYIEGQFPLNFELIEIQIFSLQSGIRAAFEATITDHAKRVWT